MTKPKDYFALILRIFGVILFAYGFQQLIDLFLGYLNYYPVEQTYFRYFLILSLGYIVAGLFLVRRGAPLIVDYAYPDDDDDDEFVEEIGAETDVLSEIVKDEKDVSDAISSEL